MRHRAAALACSLAALAAIVTPLAAQQPERAASATKARSAPPALAARAGLLPLQSTGVIAFRQAHATFDGRGVLIGILDSGLDPTIPGLLQTTTGEAKVLDLRDFSGEGRVALAAVTSAGDSATVAGVPLAGLGAARALATDGKLWAGALRERVLGEMPAADLNGDGDDEDALPVVVVRTAGGWALLADTDQDGSLAGEAPVHDYLVARETFGWHAAGAERPLALAVNVSGTDAPVLDLYFDTSAHGSHVAGIAAGHDVYGVNAFNGVAPGASLLGLKISDDAQGGITTAGSMARALDYAIRFAADRKLPLVLNMSFGVGNAEEGHARIDRIIDSVLVLHPDVVFAISAGNDGPGLSTLGFPGSAGRAIGVGATFPVVFRPDASGPGATQEPMAPFSSRGGELAKPDIAVPGVAYSTVPAWNTGDEIKGGTSMASPHAAGLAALLVSAAVQENLPWDAARIRQALIASARRVPGAGTLDAGAGRPDVGRALAWLEAKRPFEPVHVRVGTSGATAAFRRDGVGADTTQAFVLERDGSAPRTLRLTSDAAWLVAPASVTLDGPSTTVTLAIRPGELTTPGTYTATVIAQDADTALGPVARLVTTVAVPVPAAGTAGELALTVPVNTPVRLMVPVQAGRAAIVQARAEGEANGVTLSLHEPDGMPYRAGHDATLATYDSSAFSLDARDAVAGDYELVVQGGDPGVAHVAVRVAQSPVVASLTRAVPKVALSLRSVADGPSRVVPALAWIGGERTLPVTGTGGAPVPVPLAVPAWAQTVVVDIAMERGQWNRFTDFGFTLFDADGRQLGKEPLNYPAGRLEVKLPEGHGPIAAVLMLFPGPADAGAEPWQLQLAVRLLAKAPTPLVRDGGAVPVNLPARGTATATFAPAATRLPLPADFRPVFRATLAADGRDFTSELSLPPSDARTPQPPAPVRRRRNRP